MTQWKKYKKCTSHWKLGENFLILKFRRMKNYNYWILTLHVLLWKKNPPCSLFSQKCNQQTQTHKYRYAINLEKTDNKQKLSSKLYRPKLYHIWNWLRHFLRKYFYYSTILLSIWIILFVLLFYITTNYRSHR